MAKETRKYEPPTGDFIREKIDQAFKKNSGADLLSRDVATELLQSIATRLSDEFGQRTIKGYIGHLSKLAASCEVMGLQMLREIDEAYESAIKEGLFTEKREDNYKFPTEDIKYIMGLPLEQRVSEVKAIIIGHNINRVGVIPLPSNFINETSTTMKIALSADDENIEPTSRRDLIPISEALERYSALDEL